MPTRPRFENPPVVEVICGTTFRPLTAFEAPHYGLFWQQIRKDYPRSRTLPSLVGGVPLQIQPNEPTTITVEAVVNAPDMPRVWFIAENDQTLVQIQPDRFFFNWRTGPNRAPYPSFKWILGRFRRLFRQFEDFLTRNDLGVPSLVRAQLTYINHIKQGEGWTTLADIGRIFPDVSWRDSEREMSAPDNLTFRSSHETTDGTVGVRIHSALVRNAPLIRFDLAVTASSPQVDQHRVWDWFEAANKRIDVVFLDLTSAWVQDNVWKRMK